MNIKSFIWLCIFAVMYLSCQKEESLLLDGSVEINPVNFMKGDTVTISGKDFNTSKKISVLISGISIPIISSSPSAIDVKIPETLELGAHELAIDREGYYEEKIGVFISKYPVPEITGISPNNGKPGSIITLTGKNLGATVEDIKLLFSKANGELLYLNENESTVHPFTPILSANPKSITVKVPKGAGSGPIHIWVFPDRISDPDYHLSTHTSEFTINP